VSCFVETSDRPRVFWDPLIHPVIVTVAAEPAGPAAEVADLFDWRAIGDLASILKLPDETEHLLLSDGQRQLQLAVTEGTLLEGPVRLRCTLRGMRDIERKALSLRRLSFCRRLGRLPRSLYVREPAAARWIDKLRALDAVAAGASRREIAAGLIGEGRVAAEWSGRSDHLRLRVQRLVREGRRLARSGYRALLS
jgi:hypothetical protein